MKDFIAFSLCCCITLVSAAQDTSSKQIFKEQLIQLPGAVTLEYVEHGDPKGIPVLFLHGFTDSWHSFESTLPYLPSNIHAFAISQRGHGNSFKPKAAYHMKDFAADVAAFIKAKRLGPAVIVGHSMGGIVAQQFALDYPDLVKGLVIIDSDASFKDNAGMPEFTSEVMKLTDPVPYAFADNFQKSTLSKPIDSTYYQLLVSESLKLPAHVWKSTIQGIMQADYTSQLSLIKKPTLLLWGDQDSFCLQSDQQALQKGIRGSTIMIYKGTNHALHWEEPERFAKDLVAFIHHLK